MYTAEGSSIFSQITFIDSLINTKPSYKISISARLQNLELYVGRIPLSKTRIKSMKVVLYKPESNNLFRLLHPFINNKVSTSRL